MRPFKLVEIDNTLLVVISNPRLAAAVKAFDYAWHESDADNDTEDLTESIIAALDQFYVTASHARAS